MKRALTALLALWLALQCFAACAESVAVVSEYDRLLQMADSYLESSDSEHAVACARLAQRLEPENSRAFLWEGRLLLDLGFYEAAQASLNKALDLDPLSREAWLLQCRAALAMQSISSFESLRVFAEVLGADLHALYPDAALLHAQAGSDDEALRYFSQCDPAALNEGQKRTYRLLLYRYGRSDEAIALSLTQEQRRDAALDAAFASGELVLIPAEAPRVDADAFELNGNLCSVYGYEPGEESRMRGEIAQSFSEQAPELFSLSPAGNSVLFLFQNGLAFTLYEGRSHLLYPSDSRGAADENGKLSKYFTVSVRETGLKRLVEAEGVLYSPDGRYAAVYDAYKAVEYGDFHNDPILIDLSTGELFLAQTYGNWPSQGDLGTVSAACFSGDSRYFYYLLYGRWDGVLSTRLYRYDLVTGEATLCLDDLGYGAYLPWLAERAGGALLTLNGPVARSDDSGFLTVDSSSGEWLARRLDVANSGYWKPWTLRYSANSGYAFCNCTDYEGTGIGFMCLRPEDDFAGSGELWVITSDEDRLLSLTPDELKAAYAASIGAMASKADGGYRPALPYHTILFSSLSPCGSYALLLTWNREAAKYGREPYALWLVRLEDMALKKVNGIDLAQTYTPLNPRPLEWNTDTLLISEKNEIKAYRFKPVS